MESFGLILPSVPINDIRESLLRPPMTRTGVVGPRWVVVCWGGGGGYSLNGRGYPFGKCM